MSKKTLLLIGGLSMRASELLPVTDRLEKRGVRCLVTDNLCVGEGPRPRDDDPLTIERQASHQRQFVDKSGLATSSINIFGMSMGGMIAATMAVEKPGRIGNLILAVTSLNSSQVPTVSEETYQQWKNARTAEQFEGSVVNLFGRTTIEKRPSLRDEYIRYRLAGENLQPKKDFMRQLDSARAFQGEEIYRRLRPIVSRVTVLSGGEDALFPAPHAEEIVKVLGGVRSVVLPAGHMIHLESPDALTEAIVTILD